MFICHLFLLIVPNSPGLSGALLMSQELDSDAGRWDAWHETLKVSICFQQGSEDLSPPGPSGLRGFGASGLASFSLRRVQWTMFTRSGCWPL